MEEVEGPFSSIRFRVTMGYYLFYIPKLCLFIAGSFTIFLLNVTSFLHLRIHNLIEFSCSSAPGQVFLTPTPSQSGQCVNDVIILKEYVTLTEIKELTFVSWKFMHERKILILSDK